jgi:hypothetical protein
VPGSVTTQPHPPKLSVSTSQWEPPLRSVSDPELRRIYRRRMATMVRRRPDPSLLFICVIKCAMHYHHYTMSREMAEQHTTVNTF